MRRNSFTHTDMDIVLTDQDRLKLDKDFAEMNARFDRIEEGIEISGLEEVDFHIEHTFTNGLYSRRIFMPAGSLLTSKIHMTQHQFVILSGTVTVWDAINGTRLLTAPYAGITEAGTRRILFVHTDSIWQTFHPTEKLTPEEVEKDIIWARPRITNKETHELAA